MRTTEEMEKMLSLARYRYMETGLPIWDGWHFALLWILQKPEEEDYKFMPKTQAEAVALAAELGIPRDWIGAD